ncbi:putative bifunctional diguanylate cyclase/phosphodiesterase [Rhizorhapis sp. SPR117]|uniref:putative bifunctional diguanylate cyclase/phosphodiesterase n=1 Tax=Rhizorhapis sp. SPR117 TaxID=2912611 RepID=UPI001F2E18A6|nr:EAL domain-containing protein [Rhizorhapis sp. SPR117]
MLDLRNIILELIAKGADLKATTDRLCVEIEALAPGIVCSVLTVDREGLLHPLSAPSLPEAYCAALEGLLIGPDVGSCGSAAFLSRPVIVTDVASDPRWAEFKDLALPLGFRACWSTPIVGETERVIGTFALYSREARAPTKAEQAIVDACIHLCAIALERHERVLERERRANVDLLTGLGNRAAFNTALSQLPCHEPGTWALLVLDLDNLKVINDGFGHHAGDQLIQVAATRTELAASPNRVFRIGGDEFAILIQSPDALRDLDAFAAVILESLAEPLSCNGHALLPKATIGGAVLTSGDRTADTVRQNADFALYHAKETGRGGFVRYWPGIDTRIIHRIAAIRDVDAALRDGRVEAHYQPIVRFDTRKTIALEALCRLRMDNGGLLAAAAFQEATADVHVASELTERMLEIVAADLRHWIDSSAPIEHVGINISLADFHGGKLDQQIVSAFAYHGLPLEYLVIEITESAYPALRDKAVLEAIEALRLKGLRVALDDFGTDGGMLMPLLTMPVDMIKIDKNLVDRLAPERASAAVIGGLLHATQRLDITVVAKGVENETQATQLRSLGCTLGQGYFFSKALDRGAATSLLWPREINKVAIPI